MGVQGSPRGVKVHCPDLDLEVAQKTFKSSQYLELVEAYVSALVSVTSPVCSKLSEPSAASKGDFSHLGNQDSSSLSEI